MRGNWQQAPETKQEPYCRGQDWEAQGPSECRTTCGAQCSNVFICFNRFCWTSVKNVSAEKSCTDSVFCFSFGTVSCVQFHGVHAEFLYNLYATWLKICGRLLYNKSHRSVSKKWLKEQQYGRVSAYLQFYCVHTDVQFTFLLVSQDFNKMYNVCLQFTVP